MVYHSRLLVLFSLIVSLSAGAQSGILTGKITDPANNQGLSGAVASILSSSKKAVTESDGTYRITGLNPGKYTLEVSFVGFERKQISDIEIKKGEVTFLNITLTQADSKLNAVVVTTTSAKRESLNTLLITRKNAAVVSDGISADMIRKSPDKNTSDVLKRVSGTTIQENKFVVIRGMNDRYNEAMLNGTLLPSSEPDRKTFAFDIFPAEVVDNITIYKSASPDLPGSFSGGLVQVNTKDVPDKNFISIKAGTGINSLVIANDYYTYPGSNTDWLGFDNSKRTLPEAVANTPTAEFNSLLNSDPAAKTNLDRQFENSWGISKNKSTPVNATVQLYGGFNSRLSKKSPYPKLGAIFGVQYSSVFNYNEQDLSSYGEGDLNLYDYRDTVYSQNVLLSALGNMTFRINNNHKIFFNNISSINSSDQTVVRGGSSEVGGRPFVYANSYFFVSNKIYNGQFGGEHFLPKSKLRIKWTGYYTDLQREEPDYRFITYQKQSEAEPYSAVLAFGNISSTESGLRFYGSVEDYSKGANIDISEGFSLFKQQQTLKAGGGYFYNDRKRNIRYFNTVANPTPLSFEALYQPVNEIFKNSNFDAIEGLYFFEPELPSNNYTGYIKNITAYLMLDNKLTKDLRLVWGMRFENYRNEMNAFDNFSSPINADIKKEDWLPSANLIWSVLPKANLRASYGRTVARPLYRELAPQIFYDFLQNITYVGNQTLQPAYINNYEVRFEHFFSTSQYYSASVFYKQFSNPIEQNVVNPTAEYLFVNFTNTPEGTTQGIELELRKDFSFISPYFENLTFYTNASFIKSDVNTSTITGAKTSSRPLFGQSPYIINTSLTFSEPKSKFNVSLFYNQAGSRIMIIGGIYDNIVWEKPRPIMDFKISKSILKNGLVEFSWGDILRQNAIFFNDLNGNKKYDGKETDRIVIDRTYGYTMSLAFSYRF